MKFFTVILLLSLKCLTGVAQTNPVVISEVYGAGGVNGATFKSDFIELYNTSSVAVSIEGWSVQYASADGSTWAKTTLTGTIAAKGYYLIKQADGAFGTSNLPTPDKIGTLAMAGASGKIALVNDGTLLTGTTPTTANLVDLVGYGTTTGAETASTGTTLSGIASAERKANASSTAETMATGGMDALKGNGFDSGNNSTDFITRTNPEPQNSTSAAETGAPAGPDVTAPSISSFFPLDNGTTPIGNNPRVQFTENVVKGTGNITIKNLSNATSVTINIASASVSITNNTLTISNVVFVVDNNYAIQIAAGAVKDAANNNFAGITNDVTWNFATVSASAKTKISTIQGNGANATGGTYSIEAIVTAVYDKLTPAGYYIQEEDTDGDNNPSTSEAIFVIQNSPTVKVGDKVAITGTVQEDGVTPSFNQAVITPTTFSIVSSNNTLPAFTALTASTFRNSLGEKWEGMRVEFIGDLLVVDNFKLKQFGEISVSGDGLIYQPTQIVDLNDALASGTTTTGNTNASAVTALTASNLDKKFVIDNANASTNVTPIPFVDNTVGTVRVGASVSNLKGILGYGFSTFRVQPITGLTPTINTSRPTIPTFTSPDLTFVGFNVLNYFNGDGQGGGFPTDRGAASVPLFNKQRSKIIEALVQINADIVGLSEIENDGVGANSAIQDLVNGLNTRLGANTYTIVNDGANSQTRTTDVIRCAIIYKSAKVTPLGTNLQSANAIFSRSPIAQVFSYQVAPNKIEKFAFLVNHFKSKGGSGASGADADQQDGQAAYNDRRKKQSVELINFINNTVLTSQTQLNKFISVGDYNAYFEEDPMDVLRASGYVVKSDALNTSYLFGGQLGSLDHAVVSQNISTYTEVKKWNINSAEPLFLEYTDAQSVATSPFRCSDHDPVMVAIKFPLVTPITLKSFNAIGNGNKVELKWITSAELNNSYFEVQHSIDGLNFTTITKIDGAINSSIEKSYQYTHLQPAQGTNYYRLSQTDLDGNSQKFEAKAVKILSAIKKTLNIFPNPVNANTQFTLNSDAKDLELKVSSTDGKIVIKTKGNVTQLNQYFNKNAVKLVSGTYFVFIGNSTERYHATIIK